MCFRIMEIILRPTVSVFDSGAGPNLLRRCFLVVKWPNCIRPTHNISFKSPSKSPVNVIAKVRVSVELSDLHVCYHFGVDNLVLQVILKTSIIIRFVKGTFLMEQRIVPIRARSDAII